MAQSNKAPEYKASDAVKSGPGDPQKILTPNQARQSVKLGTMRYVLGASVLLVIVAFILAFIFTRG
jgi:hypothetical protein